MRNKIELDIGSSEFESILSKMICSHIPINYIEGYKEVKSNSLESFPKNPHLIFTANAHDNNDHFKFWSAHHVDRGIKLIGAQHGGHYGTGLWASADKHELKIFDKYFSWGWKTKNNNNIIPIPSAQLSCNKHHKPKNTGKVALISLSLPRYSYHLYSAPVSASGMKSYFNDQYNFVKTLSTGTQKLLAVRLSAYGHCWDQENQWKTKFPNIEIYKGKKSLTDQMEDIRLMVCTYNATSFLESFSANFPTIIFWDPDYWELNPSAQPYYDELREVQILHDCPKSAASKVDQIISDPLQWWSSNEVQIIKNRFCLKYARTSINSLGILKKELQNAIK